MKKMIALFLCAALFSSLGVTTSALAVQEDTHPTYVATEEQLLDNLKSIMTIRDNSDNSAFSIDEEDMVITVKHIPTLRAGNAEEQNYLVTCTAGVELVQGKNGEAALAAMPRASLTTSETGSDNNNQCKVTVTIGFQSNKIGSDNFMQITSVKAVWTPNSNNISLDGMKVRGRCSGFDIFTNTGYFEDNSNIWKSAWKTSSGLTASTTFSGAPRIQIFAGFGGTLWGDSNATIWAKNGRNWSFDFTAAYTQPGA